MPAACDWSTAGLAEAPNPQQTAGVSETNENARRWSGYVCPDCRLVFRVPRDHDGQGLVCQSCRRLLRIPAAGEPTPPLLAESVKFAGFTPSPVPATGAANPAPALPEEKTLLPAAKQRVRKRRKAATGNETPEHPAWEREASGRVRSGGQERRAMGWMLGGGLALFTLIAGAGWVALRGGAGGNAAGEVPAPSQVQPAETREVAELPPIMKRSVPSLLAETEPLARKFLEAKTVDDLLPLVHNPQRAKPRLQRQYPQGRIKPPGLAQFNTSGNLAFGESSSVVMVDVRTRNFESRRLTFVETPGGLKVDWESWAGWSEMTWPELLAALPTQATTFRVIVKRVDYYNFGFSDDSQWQSYRLESLDGEHMIFGYVQRGSAAARKIQMGSEVDHVPMILKIRFPAKVAASNNQVVIDEVVATDWLEKDE